ncbi:MAG: vitamin K epoxide reductase family protein, partial [Chloroflexota bacterium]|nr:vitamin K epoxide reductase family protein [Chloroflexota bacterium]
MQHRKFILRILPLMLIISFFFPQAIQAQEEDNVVHAVLFFSPSCPHCEQVITETLPPLFEQYNDQLSIIGISTYSTEGQELYQAAIDLFDIPDGRRGVPTLIVGDTVLVGSREIPDIFPGIIEEGLDAGGIPWPEIPGLEELLAKSNAQATAQAEATVTENVTENTETATDQVSSTPPVAAQATTDQITSTQVNPTKEVIQNTQDTIALETTLSEEISVADKFQRDLSGNIISVLVLVGMVASVVAIGIGINSDNAAKIPLSRWWIPALSVVGLVVAGYLSYVEITRTEAVCGPVGDCNTVQQSPYARLFGILPIGVLGVSGYVAILAAWAFQHYGPENWRTLAAQGVWAMTLFGTLFSIYLTFLEPFVIGATCAWCLASAVVITLQFWAASC